MKEEDKKEMIIDLQIIFLVDIREAVGVIATANITMEEIKGMIEVDIIKEVIDTTIRILQITQYKISIIVIKGTINRKDRI